MCVKKLKFWICWIFSIKSTEIDTTNNKNQKFKIKNENCWNSFFLLLWLENGNQKWLTFRCIHPYEHTIALNSLQLKIWRVDKMMRSPMAVAFVIILQLDHLMTSTLYAQHKLDANNIHCLNNRSFHLCTMCACKLEIITVN